MTTLYSFPERIVVVLQHLHHKLKGSRTLNMGVLYLWLFASKGFEKFRDLGNLWGTCYFHIFCL